MDELSKKVKQEDVRMITRYFLYSLQYVWQRDKFRHKQYEFDSSLPEKLDYEGSMASVDFVLNYSDSPHNIKVLYNNWHLEYPYLKYPKQKSMIEGLAV